MELPQTFQIPSIFTNISVSGTTFIEESENVSECEHFCPLKLNRWFQIRQRSNNQKATEIRGIEILHRIEKFLLLFSLMKRDHLSNNGVKRKKRKAFELL